MVAINNNMIILAVRKNLDTFAGFVVNSGTSSTDIGHFSSDWSISKFIDFKGEVILSN